MVYDATFLQHVRALDCGSDSPVNGSIELKCNVQGSLDTRQPTGREEGGWKRRRKNASDMRPTAWRDMCQIEYQCLIFFVSLSPALLSSLRHQCVGDLRGQNILKNMGYVWGTVTPNSHFPMIVCSVF